MSINLKVRGPKNAANISIDGNATFGDLKKLIAEKIEIGAEDFDILAGFPPSVLSLGFDESILNHIRNNESIRVQPKELSGQQAQGVAPPSKKKKATKSSSSSSQKPGSSQTPTFGARVVTLHPPPKPVQSTRKPGSAASNKSTPAPTRKRRLSSSDMAGNETDISEHLIEAVNGKKGARSKILRKVFRDAVSLQYNTTKAISRLNAVYGGQYTLEGTNHVQTLQQAQMHALPQATQLKVTFRKGLGSRTTFEETVDLIPEPLLIELITLPVLGSVEEVGEQGEQDREVLKPINLSKCSPRIFWSLVFHYGPNLLQSIQHILREHIRANIDVDWLIDRKRELSDKAKENLAQKQAEEARKQQQKNKRQKKGTTTTATATAGTIADDDVNDVVIVPTAEGQSQPVLSVPAATPVIPTPSHLLEQELAQGQWQSYTFHDIVPVEHVATVQALLGSDKLLVLANFPSISTLLSSNQQQQAFSEEQLQWWQESSQDQCAHYLWHRICGQGSELLRVILATFRLRVPDECLVLVGSEKILYDGLVAKNIALKNMSFRWPAYLQHANDHEEEDGEGSAEYYTGGLTFKEVEWMIQLCHDFITIYPWMNNIMVDIFDDFNDRNNTIETTTVAKAEDAEDAEEEEWGEEGWVFLDAQATEYMGKRCRILVHTYADEEEEDDDEEGGVVGKSISNVNREYWEDCTIVGYLPPTAEEPMALWKVKMDEYIPALSSSSSSSSSSSTTTIRPNSGKFEDLELHEVQQAIALFEQR